MEVSKPIDIVVPNNSNTAKSKPKLFQAVLNRRFGSSQIAAKLAMEQIPSSDSPESYSHSSESSSLRMNALMSSQGTSLTTEQLGEDFAEMGFYNNIPITPKAATQPRQEGFKYPEQWFDIKHDDYDAVDSEEDSEEDLHTNVEDSLQDVVCSPMSVQRKTSKSLVRGFSQLFRLSRDRTSSITSTVKSDSGSEPLSPISDSKSTQFGSRGRWSTRQGLSPLTTATKRLDDRNVLQRYGSSRDDENPQDDFASVADELEVAIKDGACKAKIVDDLKFAKEDLQFKVQFINAVQQFELEEDMIEMVKKASKTVKRYIGTESAFRLEGIPAQ